MSGQARYDVHGEIGARGFFKKRAPVPAGEGTGGNAGSAHDHWLPLFPKAMSKASVLTASG